MHNKQSNKWPQLTWGLAIVQTKPCGFGLEKEEPRGLACIVCSRWPWAWCGFRVQAGPHEMWPL